MDGGHFLLALGIATACGTKGRRRRKERKKVEMDKWGEKESISLSSKIQGGGKNECPAEILRSCCISISHEANRIGSLLRGDRIRGQISSFSKFYPFKSESWVSL